MLLVNVGLTDVDALRELFERFFGLRCRYRRSVADWTSLAHDLIRRGGMPDRRMSIRRPPIRPTDSRSDPAADV